MLADLSLGMREFLAILLRHHVDFLICGGHAVAFYGYLRMTMELDILIRPNKQNADRLKAALCEFGFTQAGIPWQAFETEGAAVSLGVQPNQIDLLTSVSGQASDEVFANANTGRIADYDVLFISRDDLLRAKREASRPKDQVDIDELNKIDNNDELFNPGN